jgi:hypothetical protein
MIPPFNDSGYLPPGVHPATLAEIEERFGRSSELRRVQMDSVRWMIDLARRAGVQRIILNGSFATAIMEPNDVDCVLLVKASVRSDPAAEDELRNGLPFLDLALVGQADFDDFIQNVFSADRAGNPKGLIEVLL